MRSPLTSSSLRCALAAAAVVCALDGDASAADLTAPPRVPSVEQARDIPSDIVRIARAEYAKGIREVPMGSNNSARIARYRSAMIPRGAGSAAAATN